MSKTKVFFYKKGCHPRIFINPNHETIVRLKREGEILINPNEQSTKGLPLAHTEPDHKNNMLRPLPIPYRPELKSLENPMKAAQREADGELNRMVKYIKRHRLEETEYKAEIRRNFSALEDAVEDEVDSLHVSFIHELDNMHMKLEDLMHEEIDYRKRANRKVLKVLAFSVALATILNDCMHNQVIIKLVSKLVNM